MSQKLVKLVSTGRKTLVEYVATVNKIPYFIEVNRPDRVYTASEIRELKKK